MPRKSAVRIKLRRAVKTKTRLACAKCGAVWNRNNNPAICPVCGEGSFGIAVSCHRKEKANGTKSTSKTTDS